ncbi:MAG: uracil-DNA glycosylase [Ignavibacteriaceae bacterium]|jgi:DNA polymerase|nr:uracil-DNA glycosylase [Ignavibacterium sp.]MCC6253282.1 uracil-DNA glycosylase [Ignavibacteriaceae bacterium]HMN25041.1 uracil-DNA glycosylase [Ignavibacteriaceae bacterium]HRN26946.1 uracil-DNA glycosylase [Ignavibacteriaceae bacterium]HRP93017.1 uracil-DNA glycosylase [Ignavibacteriaceae bacterium]
MNTSSTKKIIEALKDQQSIFGDELFEEKNITSPKNANQINKNNTVRSTRKSSLVKEPASNSFKNTNAVKGDWEKAETLDELNTMICNCTNCVLHKGRNKFVFGTGNPNADVVVIGEGPGAEEDKQGLPFVGRAGKLLTDILKAIKFERDEVYICNIVKCRPPDNRTPLPDEMETCIPYLKKQIELIKPKLILCLGLTAAKGLLKNKGSLTSLRGQVLEYEGIKTMVTFHPAALLRNPNWKKDCWVDVQKFRKLYDEMG